MPLVVLDVGVVAQATLDGDLEALGQATAQRLGAGTIEHAADEVGVVLPLAGLRVLATVVDRDREGEHGLVLVVRSPKLCVPRQVAG